MNQYHKIQTVFKRDPSTNHKTLLEGEWSKPEFCYLQDNSWYFTEKVDGTNIRVMWNDGLFKLGGKTDNAQIPATLIERLQSLFDGETYSKVEEMFPEGNVCFYGEGYGAKIQKGGGNYRQEQDFVLFDIWVNGIWLERKNVEDIAQKLGLDIVPTCGIGNLWQMRDMCEEGFTSQWGDFTAEGIVARPVTELNDRLGNRIITKLKYKDFLR